MPAAAGEAALTSVQAKLHPEVARHTFVGGNAFLLRMLKDHGGDLGVIATPAELEASAQRSEALLSERTATLSIENAGVAGGRATFDVNVRSMTGHKFPTGYPARRAWLHVVVRDGAGRVLFESGAPNADGSVGGRRQRRRPPALRAPPRPHHRSRPGAGL